MRAAAILLLSLFATASGCGGGCGAKSSAPVAAPASAAPEEPAPTLPPSAPDPGRSATPATPEQLATDAVNAYFAAMQRGDLQAMRERMGGEMATQFDRAVAARGEAAMREAVKKGVALRPGPARPAGDGAWVVSCRPPAPPAGKAPAMRVDLDVRRDGSAYRIYRLTTSQPDAARPTP